MKLVFSFLMLALTYSCASPGAGPKGQIYSNTKIGIYATGEKSTNEGTACTHSVLGLFAFGDSSIHTIKEKSGIKEVTDVNWQAKNFLGLYASLCVIIGGKS